MGAVDLKMPVLIVDDYKTMIRIIRVLMNQLGFENVDEASDGNQALEKLRSQPYSLVISDWSLQPMSGLDLLRQVRSDSHLNQLPFVMIAGEHKDENAARAKEAGVNGFIVKPFNATTLKSRLTPIIGKF